MGNDLTKKVLVVKEMTSNKAVIQFVGDDTYHEISQKVQGYELVKFGIVPGATVDVTFDTNGQVVYLKAQKGVPKSQPSQTSAPFTGNEDIKMWTVKAIAKNKKVIKFEESPKPWDNVSSEIEALDLKSLGIVPKAKVLVTFTGENVTAISLATVTPDPMPEEKETKQSSSGYHNTYSTNNSIERQVCAKEAGAIVRSLIEMARDETNDIEKIKNLLKDLTKITMEALNQ